MDRLMLDIKNYILKHQLIDMHGIADSPVGFRTSCHLRDFLIRTRFPVGDLFQGIQDLFLEICSFDPVLQIKAFSLAVKILLQLREYAVACRTRTGRRILFIAPTDLGQGIAFAGDP